MNQDTTISTATFSGLIALSFFLTSLLIAYAVNAVELDPYIEQYQQLLSWDPTFTATKYLLLAASVGVLFGLWRWVPVVARLLDERLPPHIPLIAALLFAAAIPAFAAAYEYLSGQWGAISWMAGEDELAGYAGDPRVFYAKDVSGTRMVIRVRGDLPALGRLMQRAGMSNIEGYNSLLADEQNRRDLAGILSGIFAAGLIAAGVVMLRRRPDRTEP